MKFATLLLLSSVSAQSLFDDLSELADEKAAATTDKPHDHWKPTPQQVDDFMPLFEKEMARYENLPESSKYNKIVRKYLSGHMDREVRQQQREMYKEGGLFDQFAGDDDVMSLEEAFKMDKLVRDHISKELGEKFPDYPKRFETKWYNQIDKLSPDVKGVTKEDARHFNRLQHAARNQYRIRVEEIKKFWPSFMRDVKKFRNAPKDSKLHAEFEKRRNGDPEGDDKNAKELISYLMRGKGNVFDMIKGEDNLLNEKEYGTFFTNYTNKSKKLFGDWISHTPEEIKADFDLMNSINSDVDGISKKDMWRSLRIQKALGDRWANSFVSDVEVDMYTPLAKHVIDRWHSLPEGSAGRTMFDASLAKRNKKMEEMFLDQVDDFDTDHDGHLNRHEFGNMMTTQIEEASKLLGQVPAWTKGDHRLMWTMADAVSDGKWNNWERKQVGGDREAKEDQGRRHHRGNNHGDGVTKKDLKRMNRIMFKAYGNADDGEDNMTLF